MMANKENLPSLNRPALPNPSLQLPTNPSEQHLQKVLIDMRAARDVPHSKYQTVISSLQGLVQ